MISPDDCHGIANFILQRSEGGVNFVVVMVDKDGNERQFGFGCEKCMSEILFRLAGVMANKPHINHDIAN